VREALAKWNIIFHGRGLNDDETLVTNPDTLAKIEAAIPPDTDPNDWLLHEILSRISN